MSAAAFAKPPRPPAQARREALTRVAAGFEEIAAGMRDLVALEESVVPAGPRPLQLLTVEDVAKLLKCTGAHVRDRCRRGQLKAMRDGKLWRISEPELEAYVRRRTQT